ncbi:MAG: transcriptional regulator [Caulobacter sp.]|nr:transcriptional regulator [Caulobacter sp.]
MRLTLQPRVFTHDVDKLGLATDEALAALLDRYPEELFDINAYSYDAEGQVSLETGARGRAPGAAILDEIKAGRLWVNLRDAHEAHPDLWNPIHEAFQRNCAAMGVKPIKTTGQLILSSPGTKVPYHFDAAGVMLFHLRGRKRLFVYPNDETHLPQAEMESVIMRTTTEELTYSRAYDAQAQVFDLEPGQCLTWPLYAPHRVENLDVFNVSLSLDFQTWETRLTRGAHYANGVLRRRLGMTPAGMAGTPMAARAALWAASLAMKKAGLVENRIKDYEHSFELGADKRAAGRAAA